MDDRLGSYIHVLDMQKYNRIIERAILETVQDFLASKGVDRKAMAMSDGVSIGNFPAATIRLAAAAVHSAR